MLGGALIGPVSAAVGFSREDREFIRKTARKIANKRTKKLQLQINDRHTKAEANSLPASGRVAIRPGTSVKFNRDVSNCAYTANYDQGSSAPDGAFATVDTGAADTVIVNLWDPFGMQISGAGLIFHLIVVCR